jgi:hypothetical protein
MELRTFGAPCRYRKGVGFSANGTLVNGLS